MLLCVIAGSKMASWHHYPQVSSVHRVDSASSQGIRSSISNISTGTSDRAHVAHPGRVRWLTSGAGTVSYR